jgi:hypothetical protein
MKIIIPNIPIPILLDIVQCLESIKEVANIQPLLWNVQHKSITDMFDEIQPNLLFIHESQLDMAFEMLCQELEFEYILVGNQPIPSHISKTPKVILTDNPETQFNQTYIPIRPLARIAQIHNAKMDHTIESEVLVNTTNITITPDIQKLLLFLSNKYKTKIFGQQPIRSHHYIGDVDMFQRANLIKSAKCVVDFTEYDFWDASYLKIPCICMNPRHPFIMPFNNIQNLNNNLHGIINNNIVRSKYIMDCYEKVYENNTSYHLSSQVFKAIDLDDIATTLIQYVESLKI